jgi:hypothetical protein
MSRLGDLRLRRLHIEGYGRLQDYTLEPARAPGVMVIAPNEAGKSTVCSALYRCLFGFDDKALEELRRPWGGGAFKVAVQWSVGPDLACAIERDFDTQKVTVEWRRTGKGRTPVLERRWEGEPNPRGRSSDRAAYEAELRRLLGFASSKVFRQTGYVGPGDPGAEPLANELLRLLSGSDRTDFRAALVEFEAQYYDLTQLDIRGSGRPVKQKMRRIEDVARERAELFARRDQALAARAARRGAEEAIHRARARTAEIEEELEHRLRTEGALRRLAELRREVADAEARRDELDTAIGRFVDWEKQVRDKTAELEVVVRYLHVPRDFPERLRAMRELGEERGRMGEEVVRLRAALAAEPSRAAEIVLGGLGLAAAIAAMALAASGASPLIYGAAGLPGLLLLGLAAWQRRKRMRRRRKLLGEWSLLEGEAARLEEEHREAASPLPPGLDHDNPETEIDRYERAQRLRAELDGMQAARAAMGDREALERERRVVKEERLDVLRLEQRKLIEAHPYLDWGPDYERQFTMEQEKLKEEAKRLAEEELAQRRRLADVGGSEEDPLRLEARVAELDQELERLALDRDAYRLAFETLTACKDDFVRVMTQRLQTRIGRVFEEMTGGRYDAVEIDPASLELTVHGMEKREVPAESLSRGTRDQLFFALRVALLEELSADRALPLVLDDPFLHFDRERLARVEETLERLGESHQILLFTHDARMAGWGFPKQFLPAPATREEVPASGG